MTSHTTILKLKQLHEWIAFDGNDFHLTGERNHAHPFKDAEVGAKQKEFQQRFHYQIESQDWIVFPATFEETEISDIQIKPTNGATFHQLESRTFFQQFRKFFTSTSKNRTNGKV